MEESNRSATENAADSAGEAMEAAVGPGARDSLSESGEHLREAARVAGQTLRGAASAVREEIGSGGHRVREELGEAASAGRKAAREARAVAGEKFSATMDQAMEKGRGLWNNTREMISERPLVAFGVALAAGYLLAQLTNRRD